MYQSFFNSKMTIHVKLQQTHSLLLIKKYYMPKNRLNVQLKSIKLTLIKSLFWVPLLPLLCCWEQHTILLIIIDIISKPKNIMICKSSQTRYVDGMPTSEVTPVTIRYIGLPHHGHTSQYHGHEWMTHILFGHCQSAPIPEIKLFKTLTLKLQGQGHGCGQRVRSYNWPSIILTHFLFISHQSDQQFRR